MYVFKMARILAVLGLQRLIFSQVLVNVSKELVIKEGRLVFQGSLKKLKRKEPVSAMVCVDIIGSLNALFINCEI